MTERDRYTGDYDTVESEPEPPVGPCLLAPQTLAVGVHYTPTVDMQGYEKCLFDILGGAADHQDCSLEIVVLQSTTPVATQAAAPDAKVLAGLAGSKYISEEEWAALEHDYAYSGYYYYKMNRKWLIEVDVEEMDVDNLFRYLQLAITVGSEGTCTGWMLAAEAIRSLASYEPCPQTHADQVVA